MTNLEIILLAALWVIYGVYHGYKWMNKQGSSPVITKEGFYILSILFAPVCLVIRLIKGVLWL